jgi:hypothetical protein
MSLSRRNFIKMTSTAAAALSTGIVTANSHVEADELVNKIAGLIGQGVQDISFSIKLPTEELKSSAFNLRVSANTKELIRFTGTYGLITAAWEFKSFNDGFWVNLSLSSPQPLNCSSVTPLRFTYKVPSGKPSEWRIPNIGEKNYYTTGLTPLAQLTEESKTETVIRGAFKDSKMPGVFVGSYLPQRNKHYYTVSNTPNNSIAFDCTTFYTAGQSKLKELTSETTWICAKKNLNNSIASYATHIPINKAIKVPPIGWNSWDYYYSTVSAADIIENMEAIQADKVLSQKIKYILIDMGWAEQEGEWYGNHRFPGGMQKIAKDIGEKGFIPGIWTAPLWINTLSPIALRKPHMLIKNEYGDPQSVDGRYVLDPTHPESKEHLKEVYTRLYNEGYRFFKVDYLDAIIPAYGFHKPEVGCYEALREMYAVIKSCIKDSHLLAATAFPECGPGILDSGRVSIDIHNQWTHVKWGLEAIQLRSWMHKRLFYIDPDFIVVRGEGTSTEKETTVTDPVKNAPNHPRWRSGPTFNLTEAQTHVNVVALTGGSVVLSDRISKLTKQGLELIYKVIDSTEVPAKALDLGDDTLASIWYQDLGRGKRLTVINWEDKEVVKPVSVKEYGIKLPGQLKEFWSGEMLSTKDGQFSIPLKAHESKVYVWS